MGGGGSGSSSTTKTEIPKWQVPYMQFMMSEAKNQYGTPLTYYQGNTIAPFSEEQRQAQSLQAQRALYGSPLEREAQSQLLATVSGQYLSPDSNPYLPFFVQKGFEQVVPHVNTTATQAGRYGSDAWGQLLGRAMGETVAGIYAPAYESERQRQIQALQLAPSMAQIDYENIARLAQVGAEKQQMEQALINESIQRHQFEQMEPWQRLFMLAPLVSAQVGGTTVSTTQSGGK